MGSGKHRTVSYIRLYPCSSTCVHVASHIIPSMSLVVCHSTGASLVLFDAGGLSIVETRAIISEYGKQNFTGQNLRSDVRDSTEMKWRHNCLDCSNPSTRNVTPKWTVRFYPRHTDRVPQHGRHFANVVQQQKPYVFMLAARRKYNPMYHCPPSMRRVLRITSTTRSHRKRRNNNK